MTQPTWLNDIQQTCRRPLQQIQDDLTALDDTLQDAREKTTTWEDDRRRIQQALPEARKLNRVLEPDPYTVSTRALEEQMDSLAIYARPDGDERMKAYKSQNWALRREIARAYASNLRGRALQQLNKLRRGLMTVLRRITGRS